MGETVIEKIIRNNVGKNSKAWRHCNGQCRQGYDS